MSDLKPAMLIVDFRSFSSDNKRVQFLFNSGDEARSAQARIVKAAEAFDHRANDREKLFTFETASGPSTIDVSDVLACGVDDPLGMAKDAHETWNISVFGMNGRASAAMERAKAEALATPESSQ